MEWQIDLRMPRFDDVHEYEVWMRNGAVRRVRRIGNRSTHYSPGILVYTDCTSPMQNAWCDEEDVIGWRHSGRLAPPMPVARSRPLLSALFAYDASAPAARL